ncbi:MAG: hypothetical protein K6E21_00415 [Bacilli bacterium]|nr:hypothetical protein [Bacilli bacterium]
MEKTMTIEEKKKLSVQSGLVLAGILLLCFFFGFSYIWNTDYGAEAGVNGWNYFIACITWTFKDGSNIYGDGLAVPFNYYAKYYVRVLAIFTTVAMALVIAFTVLSILGLKKYSKKLEKASTIILYVLAAAFLGCIIVALTMNGSGIIKKYCNGNPNCSVHTLAFFPFFISLILKSIKQ